MRSLFVLTVLLALAACSKKEEAVPAAVDSAATASATPEVVAGTPTVTETSSVTVAPAATPAPATETPAPVVSK
jgi:hypothetical protein